MFGVLKNRQDERLDYDYLPGAEGDSRIVILGHGVTGNKDRPVVAGLAEALQKSGIASIKFSFAGNGESQGRFVDCTLSKEVNDLGAVLDVLEEHGRVIAYAGHSLGGAAGVMRAAKDPRIKVLISLAGMVDCHQFAQREFGEETPDEGCMWEEESCPLSSTFMNDMAAVGSIVDLGSAIKVPWLLLHGTEDDVVPMQDSIDIEAKAVCEHEVIIIEGADHSFTGHMPQMTEKAVSWVQKYLH